MLEYAVDARATKNKKKIIQYHDEVLYMMGVIPGRAGGGGGGAVAPPTFGQQHFFRGFLTPLKVPSEVVLMGSFMSVMVMSDKTATFQLKSQ